MKRHELDVAALVAGLVFLGVAAAYLLGIVTGFDLDARWVAPVALIGLGVGGLLAALSRLGREAGSRPQR